MNFAHEMNVEKSLNELNVKYPQSNNRIWLPLKSSESCFGRGPEVEEQFRAEEHRVEEVEALQDHLGQWGAGSLPRRQPHPKAK